MTEPRKYRAICFDLDGTLLPMDLDEFIETYFRKIAAFAASKGVDPERFMNALKLGTAAMIASTDGRTNEEVFWDKFFSVYGEVGEGEYDPHLMADSFYSEEFDEIGADVVPEPNIVRAVNALIDKGYPLLLTTMPLFPLLAVQHRIRWAGLEPEMFKRITTYSNSRSTKPHQTYFAEDLAAMGLCGEDVLMVGNNTVEDLAFMDLGVDAYLITDWLLNPAGLDINEVRHGSFKEFAEWVETLPNCENPVTEIAEGPVPFEETLKALEDNRIAEADAEAIKKNAAASAEVLNGATNAR